MDADQVNRLVNLVASVTLFEMMVAIGLGVSLADLLGVVKDWRLLGKAALASYVCVPAAAVGLLILFQADPYVAAGFLIIAVCPGAPFGPPLTGIAKGNVVVSVGLMVVLAGSSALMAPLLLQALLPLVLANVPHVPSDSAPPAVDAVMIVRTLLVAQFLPLCIGLGLRHWWPELADKLKKPANLLSLCLNLMMLVLVIGSQIGAIISVPLRGYLGMFFLVLISAAAGWLFGGPGKNTRTAMVMATSIRNVAVGLVIVTGAFAGTRAVGAATVFALFQTLVMALLAVAWGRMVTLPDPAIVSQATSSGVNHVQKPA